MKKDVPRCGLCRDYPHCSHEKGIGLTSTTCVYDPPRFRIKAQDVTPGVIVEGFALELALERHRSFWAPHHLDRGVDQVIEEMAELTQALLHSRRGELNREEVVDEIADVCLCLELVAREFTMGRNELLERVASKAARLDVRLSAVEGHKTEPGSWEG